MVAPQLAPSTTHRGRILFTNIVDFVSSPLSKLLPVFRPSSSPLTSQQVVRPPLPNMFFSKTLVAAVALCLSVSLQVSAHAAIAPQLGVDGDPVRRDVLRPTNARPCGRVDIAENFDSSATIPLDANNQFQATITNFNRSVSRYHARAASNRSLCFFSTQGTRRFEDGDGPGRPNRNRRLVRRRSSHPERREGTSTRRYERILVDNLYSLRIGSPHPRLVAALRAAPRGHGVHRRRLRDQVSRLLRLP